VLSARMPDLAALQMLRLVHDRGSLSAAGKALGLSQQAVSSRMKALEDQIGSSLLTRSARGSTLTPTGTLVAGWALDVLNAAELLGAGIAAIRHGGANTLRVVASQTIAEYLLPGWLVTLRQRQEARGETPSAVELHVANSRSSCALVSSGAVDLGFVETTSVPADLKSKGLGQDDMVVVVSPGHSWTRRRRPLAPAELAGTPMVTREPGSGTRGALQAILAKQAPENPPASPVVELSTNAAVRSAIARGIAPGVLSTLAVHDDVLLGRLVAVPTQMPLRRPLTAIWQRGKNPRTGPARDLIAIAVKP
jgi:DNA-binding transcriptional LysR family regulator